MIVIPRGLARSFRALARKCSTSRPRGPAPPVTVVAGKGRLTLSAVLPDSALTATVPLDQGDSGGERVVVPADVFDAADPSEPVELVPTPSGWVARYVKAGDRREKRFDPVTPAPHHEPPVPPRRWADAPAAFLTALHECGRMTTRDPARFALDRVQVRGKAGQVVGTDGARALAWGGFALPFADDLLVPAVPAFGAKELAGRTGVRVGRSGPYLAVAAGPWTVFLAVDRGGKFPDVAGIVPRGGTTLDLSLADAGRLIDVLADLPCSDGDPAVVLDLGPVPAARAGEKTTAVEVSLAGSTLAGPAVAVAVARKHLLDALRLGLFRVRATTPSRPVAFSDENRTYLALALGEEAVSPPDEPIPAAPAADPGPTERGIPVPPSEPAEPTARAGPPPDDPLVEAEALRDALAEAGNRAARLIQTLRRSRRSKRVLETAWTALKALNLDPGGRP